MTLGGRSLSFPSDDAAHEKANTEWWYYNGHLETESGGEYGFHYVVFQVSVPDGPTGQIGHLAITDHQEARYVTDQKAKLASAAGVLDGQFAFKLGQWLMSGSDGADQLRASTGAYAFDLTLKTSEAPVLHGTDGVVGFGVDAPSYYYSRPRMDVSGEVRVDGTAQSVHGTAWFDHQWGNFQPRALGWDWFAIQTDAGHDLMLTVLRDTDGNRINTYGTLVNPDRSVTYMDASDFQVDATDTWTSPRTDATYPMGWTVSLPEEGLELVVDPVLQGSEFDATGTTRNVYWEGDVRITGTHSGRGFVELVGYAGS